MLGCLARRRPQRVKSGETEFAERHFSDVGRAIGCLPFDSPFARSRREKPTSFLLA